MKHAVILFDERDEHVAERLEKSLLLMQRKGELKTYSRLHIQPGSNVQETIESQIAESEVVIIVLSIDLNQDLIFYMIGKHKEEKTDLLVVYANYVDEELIDEFLKNKIPVTPIMPVAEYKNQDFAYQKITKSIREQLVSHKAKSPKPRTKKLLILLAARRKIPND